VFATPVGPTQPRNAPAPVTTAFDQADADQAETPIDAPAAPDAATRPFKRPADPDGAASVHYTQRFAARGLSDVGLQPTTIEDIDRLWDWVRSDREGTTAFLGLAHQTTTTFFQQIAMIGQKERDGVAWLRSIKRDRALIGFVILDPIQSGRPPVGRCHIYVSVEERGHLPEFLPSILADGDRLLPGMTLFVATDSEAMASLLKAAGFTSQFVLTRSSPGVPHGPEAI
jgi:hypothetical protein